LLLSIPQTRLAARDTESSTATRGTPSTDSGVAAVTSRSVADSTGKLDVRLVPAYGADQLASTSSLPCYLNFCIHAEAKRLTAVNANRETHSLNTADLGQRPVDVIVTWRSDDGECSTQLVHSD
jgi:hypothetical protein